MQLLQFNLQKVGDVTAIIEISKFLIARPSIRKSVISRINRDNKEHHLPLCLSLPRGACPKPLFTRGKNQMIPFLIE